MTRASLAIALVLALGSPARAAGPARAARAAETPPASFLRLYTQTRGFSLGRPVDYRPTPDGQAVLFLRSAPRSAVRSLFEFDLGSGRTRELLSPGQLLEGAAEQLSPAERARRERMRVSTRGFTTFDLSDDGALVLVSLSGRLYTVRRQDGAVRALPAGASPLLDPHLSPDGKQVAYVRDRDLYVLELASGRERRLTHSPAAGITNGLAEFVAEEELDRFRGFWWSPDSTELAFEEADSRAEETFHLVDALHPEHLAEPRPYPRPGKANATVRLGIVPVRGGTPRWVRWDERRFPYLAQVVWQDRAPLTLVVLSRRQRDLQLLTAEPRSGRTRLLVAEHDNAWINLDPTVPRWLSDGSGFVWSSERSGAWALELRSRAGTRERALSGPAAGYQRLVDLDPATRRAWFIGGAEPTETQLYQVSLDHGAPVQVTREPGIHTAVFGKNHRVYVLGTTTATQLPRATVHRIDRQAGDRQMGELPSVALAPPFSPRVEFTRVGKPGFRAELIRPRSFVAGHPYPVVVSVYGGPHVRMVRRAMGALLLDQYIADHGFIVVSIDGRGTPGRGRAWERAIRGDFTVPLADQATALTALGARYQELDLGRVGIFGWSFGGYMAALAVLERPEVFKVAVAGAPVVDWHDYDTAYTERYLGLPAEDPAGYRKSSLLTYAARLSRPLLIVHGTRDDNVYFFQSLELCNALLRAGRRFDFLPLPGLTHMVRDPVAQEALYGRILGTLEAALHPAAASKPHETVDARGAT